MSAELDARLGNPDWVDNWTVDRGLRFELMEQATGRVFICQHEVTADELAAFETPVGYGHALAGHARADLAYFARSPQAREDGPVDTIELCDRTFAFIAQPVGFETLESGATQMMIDKHHSMLYRADRVIDVLDFGDGTVATPAWGSLDVDVAVTDSMLSGGWRLRRVQLLDDLVTVIPNPAQVIVLDKAFGFHGPVPTEVVDAVGQEANQ